MYKEYGMSDNGEMLRATENSDSASEDERKKKLAAIASMITGQATPVEASYSLIEPSLSGAKNALNTAQQAIQGTQQPQGPVMPEEVAQERQQPVAESQPPVAPVAPVVEQVNNTQLPQAGPATQVAGPVTAVSPAQVQEPVAQAQPKVAEVSKPALDDVFHKAFVDASNSTDPKERRNAFAQLIGNPQVPEGIKSQANQMFVQDYQNERAKQEAIKKLENATPNDIARYMQEKSKDEGSYVKAILFTKLGLTELAKQEQEKLSPSLTASSATDSTNGQRYTVYRNKAGEVIRAFNSEGQKAGQDEIARLGAATLPTSAHQLPAVHGSPVQRTVQDAQGNSKTETGLIMYDPQSQSSYVQVGNKRLPTTGWTTMSQNPESVANAAGAKVTGEKGAMGFDVSKPGAAGAAGIAQSLGIPVISGNRTTDQQAALYQQSVDAGTPGRLPNGNPVAKPGTSAHESNNAIDVDSSKLTPDQRKALAVNGIRKPLPKTDPNHWEYDARTANKKSPLYKQEIKAAAEKKEAEVIAEAKGKEGAATIKKQAFADNAYPIVKELGAIIKESTGSGIGASVDSLAAQIGASPKGAQAIAKLETFASPLVSMVPRFEGSQSDRDVLMYQKQAGDFANPKLPIATRLAALQGMVKLLEIYDKDGANDWSAISGQQEKTINGVTYVFDGKGWKAKK